MASQESKVEDSDVEIASTEVCNSHEEKDNVKNSQTSSINESDSAVVSTSSVAVSTPSVVTLPKNAPPPAPSVASQAEKDMKQHLNLKGMLSLEKKFSSRNRLFFGNVPLQSTDEEIIEMFRKFGETKEYYVNRDRGWGFIKMDYRINAEIAKSALDNLYFKGRNLRVKFATHGSAVEVHGLGPATSNELLEKAFLMFGEVERATVVCDMKGKTRGYGIVEFGWKKPAHVALAKAKEGFFVLGRLPKPVTVKMYDQCDYVEGVREKDLARSSTLPREREYLPRFVMPGSPDYAWCQRWKEFEDLAKEKRDALEQELKMLQQSLEKEMEVAMTQMEHESKNLEIMKMQEQARLHDEARQREEMLHREMLLTRQREFEIRGQDDTSLREELRQQEFRRQEEFIRRQQMELEMRKRETTEEFLRETAMRSQSLSGSPARAPFSSHHLPPASFDMPQMPRMPLHSSLHGLPPDIRGPGQHFPSQMNDPPRGLPHPNSMSVARRGLPPPPSHLDGFFENKRPRMN